MQQDEQTSKKPHWIEWATGLASGLIVLLMISWIAYQAVTQVEEAPRLSINILQTTRTGSTYQVIFEIVNSANSTAADVVVQGEIASDGSDAPEQSEVTFDYVPGNSKATGALLFQHDPSSGQLSLRPMGYTQP